MPKWKWEQYKKDLRGKLAEEQAPSSRPDYLVSLRNNLYLVLTPRTDFSPTRRSCRLRAILLCQSCAASFRFSNLGHYFPSQ